MSLIELQDPPSTGQDVHKLLDFQEPKTSYSFIGAEGLDLPSVVPRNTEYRNVTVPFPPSFSTSGDQNNFF